MITSRTIQIINDLGHSLKSLGDYNFKIPRESIGKSDYSSNEELRNQCAKLRIPQPYPWYHPQRLLRHFR